jgi:ribosome-binding protein aMBF1 (putative translation factor)
MQCKSEQILNLWCIFVLYVIILQRLRLRTEGGEAVQVWEYLQQQLITMRQRKGWSMHELAYRSHVPQSTIWRLEHGKIRLPNVVVVRDLARAFGCDIDHLIGTHNPDVEKQPAVVA